MMTNPANRFPFGQRTEGFMFIRCLFYLAVFRFGGRSNSQMRTIVAAFVLFYFLSRIALAQAAGVQVGVGASDITPPLGIPLAGYYHERGADGVLDPLHSKAMVLEANGEKAALVVVDLLNLNRWVTDQARAEIARSTGIKQDHVMISATHAHTGPALGIPGQRSAALGSQKQLAIEYTEGLPAKIAASVQLANAQLRPVRLSVAKGRCEGLAFNRRYFMRDGTTGWNPGKLNPNIVLPAGTIDPEVGVLYIEPAGTASPAEAIATYVNFAMHPDTTGGNKVSADWPGALSRVLASYHGTNHFTVVANGTCGNINHVDVSWKWAQGGPGEQNRIGTILGASVFEAYKSLQPLEEGPLRARNVIVELPLPEITGQQVAEAKAAIDSTTNDSGTNFMRLVRAHRVVDLNARQGAPHRLEVQVISLGNAAWVALPGEIFVELGLAIKKRSPFSHTFLVELANENIGYVPDRRSFAEGNYEPESSRCAPGGGEKLVEAAVGLLQALHSPAGTGASSQ